MIADRVLVGASAAQWLCGIGGLALSLRRGHAFAFLFLRGKPEKVRRDSVLLGTALSAPMPMLALQAASTVVLSRGPSTGARTTLGVLGAAMVGGYLGEELVRHRMTRGGADPVETPLVAAGVGLATVMAGLGLRNRGALRSVAGR